MVLAAASLPIVRQWTEEDRIDCLRVSGRPLPPNGVGLAARVRPGLKHAVFTIDHDDL